MQIDRHYTDPLLVCTYDLECAGRDDIEFYLALAAELNATAVIDLGCGTGVLASDLAATGIGVTGVDPAGAMLDVARQRPGGDRVTWIEGDASSLPSAAADLVVMTGHAAQVFLTEQEWNDMLARAFRALEPGGHIAFETRNPGAGTWTRWTRDGSFASYDLGGGVTFDSWVEVTDVRPGIVTFEGHTVFAGRGDDLVSSSTLRFRTQGEVEASLAAAGFVPAAVFGDWDRGPVTMTSPELIFLARRP